MSAIFPTGMDPCLNPAVLEKTSTFCCATDAMVIMHIIAIAANLIMLNVVFVPCFTLKYLFP
jgi:hypothetical protein